MVQTSFSQIIEQILNAVVSIGAAYLFMKAVADKDKTTQAVYGAAGSALGTGAGVLIALVFMYLVYLLNKKFIHNRIKAYLLYYIPYGNACCVKYFYLQLQHSCEPEIISNYS